MSHITRVLSATLILGLLPGCGKSSEAMRQDVLKADPAFATVLQEHDALAQRMTLLERELALKKTQVDQRIAKLRRDVAEARQRVRQKVQQMEEQLKPEQDRLRFAMAMATEELKVKHSQRAGLGRSISRIRKSLQGNPSTPQWTAAEHTRLTADLQDLLGETQRLDREIEGLTSHLRLLKAKQALLRL